MSTERTIETMLADWLDATANEQDAAVIHDQGMRAVRRSRPRPTWLAVVHGGTLGGGARTHHPAVRWATLLLIVAALVAALVAGAIVGARLLQAPRSLPSPFGLAVNGSIAFSKEGHVWVTGEDSGQPRILIPGLAEDSYPLYSPDGAAIIFQRDEPGQPSRVMLANADGSEARPIAEVPGNWTWTDWSPDGRSLLVVWEVDGMMEMWILSTDPHVAARRLDLGGIVPSDFAVWRPKDGSEIIFTGFPDTSTRVGLYGISPDEVPPDGLGPPFPAVRAIGEVALTPSRDGPFQFPAVSPDGSTIVFDNWESNSSGIDNTYLHRRDLDTGEDQTISLDPAWPGVGVPVRWTPDGLSLLFESGTTPLIDGAGQLVIAPIDGSEPGRPLGPPYDNDGKESVDISPDGTTVILDVSGVTWLIDIASGTTTQSTEYLPNQPSWQRR